MAKLVKVARTGDIPPGEMATVHVDGTPVLLANVDGTLYAIYGICTHADGPLGDGFLMGDVIECPFHGGQFDLKTGQVLALPAFEDIPTYEVKIDGDDVLIAWPD